MLHSDPQAFVAAARQCPADRPALPRAAFLVAPDGFALSEQTARDNLYMRMQAGADPERALAQHRVLQRALADELPVLCFPGGADTPDAVFPNNVFATVPGRLIIGHMCHPVRRREAARTDIRDFFERVLGYAVIDLREQSGIAELTGALVLDRARGLGLAGLSDRCDATGAAAMHAAFGLSATLQFALAPGEYHSNVVMSVLAGRALVICRDGVAEPAVADALCALYAPHVIEISAAEKAHFAGNCIALTDRSVWISQTAADALAPSTRAALERTGFAIRSVALDELEKSGGSLRCCVAELF
ncbi:MAG TPA: arginine deiminase-related protein [Xanthomonadaceae bacterium]|nr:arginine deiminase-related protein [Xanthomonadaceae bacterium]